VEKKRKWWQEGGCIVFYVEPSSGFPES